jgi:hypothetical protein
MMAENLGIDWLVPPDDGDTDIGVELACAGREAIFGFDTLGELFSGPASLAMRERCPDCASPNLLVAIDRRQ